MTFSARHVHVLSGCPFLHLAGNKTPLANAIRTLRGLLQSPVLQQLLPGRLGLLKTSALLQNGFPFHQGRPPLWGASVRCSGSHPSVQVVTCSPSDSWSAVHPPACFATAELPLCHTSPRGAPCCHKQHTGENAAYPCCAHGRVCDGSELRSGCGLPFQAPKML